MDNAIADSLSIMRDDWNRRAKEDAYYYVAFINPNQAEDSFHQSAADVIRDLESELHRLDSRRRALEIGCGPGRLMLPLSRHFDEIYGVDISDEMIRIARERLQSVPNAHLQVNNGCDLAHFENDYFSFVYSYIVFQHIPSKEIVFNYLREIQRVLAPGGITRFQVRGTPPSRAGLDESITWKGCVVLDSEVVDFAREAGMELVGLSGEQTQYLWVTLRKPPRPTLRAVTSTSSGSAAVPQRGPAAAISLWIQNAPGGSDLISLSAQIGGKLVRGSYLSPIAQDGGCQMNVTLPLGLPIGPVDVALVDHGEVIGPTLAITVEPALLVPRVVGVVDAKNVAMEMRSESGGIKVLIEDVEDPDTLEFQLGGAEVKDVDVTCTNRVLEQYLFSFLVPHEIKDGLASLAIYFNGRVVYQAEIEIHWPSAPPQTAILDAVTSASTGSASAPQRGPGAAISLWIRNAPGDSDLNTLSAQINGESARGEYLSPITAEGGCQMNVRLPRNLPLGPVEVRLVQNGNIIDQVRTITIEPGPPAVSRVTAARIESGELRVLLEDIDDPGAITFQLAGKAIERVEVTSMDAVSDQYLFSFPVPREVPGGLRTLAVYLAGRVVYQGEVEIRRSDPGRGIVVG